MENSPVFFLRYIKRLLYLFIYIYSAEKQNKIHGDPRSFLTSLGFMSSKKIASGLKKTNILVTFLHCTIICFEQFAPLCCYSALCYYYVLPICHPVLLFCLYVYLALDRSSFVKLLYVVFVKSSHKLLN